MIYLQNWKFFSKTGDELNLFKRPNITIEIIDENGKNASLLPITNQDGDIVFIEILDPGINYTEPAIILTDNNGYSQEITDSDVNLSYDGEIISINVSNLSQNKWSYPSFVCEGDLYFSDKVSTGLIETENVFILEEVKDSHGDKKYTYPRKNNNSKLLFNWQDPGNSFDDKAIYLFDVDTKSELTPFIEKADSIEFNLDDGENDNVFNNQKKIIRQPLSRNEIPVQSNIAISYPDEGIFEKTLQIFHYFNENEKYLIAEIFFRGEIIPEDDRFKTILDNLGKTIDSETEFIFRDSNINEDLPDHKLLNKKRKEYILEHSNIQSFIGSYKGLFNVLNWLGYDDLRVKEYWLNVNEKTINHKKYTPKEINFRSPNRENKKFNNPSLLPSDKYKKTSLFGLYYDINRETGNFDEFGLPITEDTFMFTNEEVLIKLFALKSYLEEKFLPLNAKIIDIVGEGVYFERVQTKTWEDGTEIFDIDFSRRADFTVNTRNPKIINLQKLQDFNFFQPANIAVIRNINDGSLSFAVLDPGFGYVGDVKLEIIGGGPSSVPADITVNISGGSVASLTVNNSGLGYTSTPTAKVVPELKSFDYDSTVLNTVGNFIAAYFDGNTIENLPDSPNVPIGAPITLETTTFDITWDEMQYEWDEFYYDFQPAQLQAVIGGYGEVDAINILDGGKGYLSTPTIVFEGGSPSNPAIATTTVVNGVITDVIITDGGNGYSSVPTVKTSGGIPISDLNTWETVGFGNFYEMEWIIKGEDVNFLHQIRGRVDDLNTYPVILPFKGKYSVELILHNTLNYQTNEIKKEFITVNIPSVEFTTVARFGQCFENWDDLDLTWQEMNSMWIQPIKHETSWDDLDLTWDDLDNQLFINEKKNFLPEIEKKEILRITETDRFFGNLTDIDFSNNEITVANPPNRPPITAGDFLYFRDGENVLRRQVVNSEYFYNLQKIIVDDPGQYQITFDFISGEYIVPGNWGNVTPGSKPIAIIDDPISGTTATGLISIDGEIVDQQILTGSGQGYLYKKGGNSIPGTSFSGSITEFEIVFINPNPNGTSGSIRAEFDNTNGSFLNFNFSTFNPGSGYQTPPLTYKIIDADGDEIVNDDPAFTNTSEKLEFQEISIKGGIEKIILTNPGSGYTTIPNVNISPDVSGVTPPPTLTNGSASVKISTNSESGKFILTNIPSSLNNNWEVLREINQSVILKGNQVFNPETNPNGLNIGQWLSLQGTGSIKKEDLEISNTITNNLGILSGISLNGQFDFLVGEKIEIFKKRKLNYLNGTEFTVDTNNNEIIIIDPENQYDPFNPSLEIEPGFHEIELVNIENGVISLSQRVRVIHITEDYGDYILKVEALDGDLNLFNNLSDSYLTYNFWDFPGKIVESNISGNETNIILNLNDWPVNENFIDDPTDWYFNYGIVDGSWSLLVTDIGVEGNETIVNVSDPNSLLWQSSNSFVAGWRKFDKIYAENRFGFSVHTWDNTENVLWNDLCHFTWNQMDYESYRYCGFKIVDVQPSGSIQFNEKDTFTFENVPTGNFETRMLAAVEELNNSDNPGISKFYFEIFRDENDDVEFILGKSKTPGGDSLGYLRFTNGVLGEYSDPTLSHTLPLLNRPNLEWQSGVFGPENQNPVWDPVYREYTHLGINPVGEPGWYPATSIPKKYISNQQVEKSERIAYLSSFSGPFNWSETMVSFRNSELPLFTTVVLTPTKSKIAGKKEYLWQIKNSETGEILIKSNNKYLIWTFDKRGNFDISLQIFDNKENTEKSEKNGFIKIF